MKKYFLKAAALGCAALLSACGNNKTKSVTPPDNQLDKCELRFSWWGGDDRHEATLNAIKLWEERYPDIKIIPEYGGWDGWTEKVTTQLSGDTEPDIMQINYDWLITMSPEGKDFYDLEKLSSNLELSGLDEEILDFGRVNGILNAVTVSVSGRGLFYNSKIFKDFGAAYPETWDELWAVGEVFGKKDMYPLDLDIQSGGTAWYLAVVYVQQTTGRQFITMDGELGFTEEDIKAALDFYKETEKHHVIRTIRTRIDEDGNAALYQSPEFVCGNVAGVLEWGSSVGKYESVLGDSILETGKFLSDGKGNTSGWMIKPSMLYAVSADTEYPDEAAEFVNFILNDKECAEVLGTTRGIPSSSYARKSLEDKGLLTGLSVENAEMLEKLDTITISPYMELSRMKEFYNTAIEKVSYGTSDTATAAQEMFDSITNYLEKIRK